MKAVNPTKDKPNRTGSLQRSFLVELPIDAANALEDLKYHLQKREQRPVTKKSLVTQAIWLLVNELGQ